MKTRANQSSAERALIVLATAYLASFALDGVIRHILTIAGIPSLLYLRDATPALAIFWTIFRWVGNDNRFNKSFVVLYIICIHALIGTLYIGNIFQVLFATKIILAFLLGFILGNIGSSSKTFVFGAAAIILLISIIGVFLNYAITFPWEGDEFETGLGTVAAVKVWSMGGIKRLSGFSRSSYDAAAAICVSLLFFTAFVQSKRLLVFIWIVSLTAVLLTTTKGALLAATACFLLIIISNFFKNWLIWKYALITNLFLMIAMPITIWIFGNEIIIRSAIPDILSSFAERATYMWPKSLLIFDQITQYIFGRGIGGIGVAQRFGFDKYFSAADNMFVYSYVTFGMFAIVYLWKIGYQALNFKGSRSTTIICILIPTFIFLNGAIVNIIEQPLLLFALGYSFSKSFSKENSA